MCLQTAKRSENLEIDDQSERSITFQCHFGRVQEHYEVFHHLLVLHVDFFDAAERLLRFWVRWSTSALQRNSS